MTTRERINRMLHFQDVDRVPVLHLGFWQETIDKWVAEGHLKQEEVEGIYDNVQAGHLLEKHVANKLGFDDSYCVYTGQKGSWYDPPLYPAFSPNVVETYPDGSYAKRDTDGVLVLQKDGAMGIPRELGHTLVDRASWEEHYKPRLVWSDDRLDMDEINALIAENETRERPLSVYCGSMFGKLRNYMGLMEASYTAYDEPEFFKEMIDTIGNISYEIVKHTLETGVKVDRGHYWEDICGNDGPLINPKMFKELCGPHYRRISDLLNSYGVDVCSVDCDGVIDHLVPIWLENGVNCMFPLEVGVWNCDFSDLRKKFGRELLGVGNMDKKLFATDRVTIDKEIERLRRAIDLGGFVPCPDHQIQPEAEWDLVRYYCDRMQNLKL